MYHNQPLQQSFKSLRQIVNQLLIKIHFTSTGQIPWGHLVVMTNHHRKFEDFQTIEQLYTEYGFANKGHGDLDFWISALKNFRGHKVVMSNHHSKFKDSTQNRWAVIDWKLFYQ